MTVLIKRSNVLASLAVIGALASVTPARAVGVAFVKTVGTASSKSNDKVLELPLPDGLAAGNLVVISFGTDPVKGNITASDSAGNNYVGDAGLDRLSPNRVRALLLWAKIETAIAEGGWIRVTLAQNAAAKAMVVGEYAGVMEVSPLDGTAELGGQGANISSGQTKTTVRADELLVGGFGSEGSVPAVSTLDPGYALVGEVGTTGTPDQSNISVDQVFNIVTAVGKYSAGGTLTGARRWDALLGTFKASGPSSVVFTNPDRTLTAGACSGTASPFTLETRNAIGAVSPTGTTTFQITSTSPSVTVYADSACTTPQSAFTIGDGTSTFTFYVRDTRKSAPTWTLTAHETTSTIPDATSTYTVKADALAGFVITLPGETFIDGVGNSGTASTQLAGTPFDIAISAVDVYDNAIDEDSTSHTFGYSGPSDGADGSTPLYTNPVVMSLGRALSLSTTLQAAETTDITITEGVFSGISSPITVVLPPDTTSLSLNTPGYSARAPGSVVVTLTNGTGGSITSVTLTAPPGFTWTNPSTSLGTWSISNDGTTAIFSGGLGSFPIGADATFTVVNTGAVYPNVAADTAYSIGVAYAGFQSAAPNALFTVRVPIGDVVLPAISRTRAAARPAFYWTNSDVNQTHDGVMIVRGATLPTDKTFYAVGDPIGPSQVLCIASAASASCVEPDSVTANDAAGVYGFYNFDASRGYSNGIRLNVLARPTGGRADFMYKHEAIGLTPATVRNSGGSGFSIFPAQDRGVYFVRANGSEERRAVQTSNAVNRRIFAASDAVNDYAAYAADVGDPNPGRVYRIDPAGDAVSALTNMAVNSGVLNLRSANSPLNGAYGADVFILATADPSGNFVRTFNRSLATVWTFDIGGDAVTTEIGVDNQRAYFFVPVGGGAGGIYAFDMSAAPGGGGAPSPWATQKILSGKNFNAKPRMGSPTWPAAQKVLFAGATDGTLYAINPDDGAVITSTTVGGSVRNIIALSSAGGALIYTTANGLTGRIVFDGAAFGAPTEQNIAGAAVVSSPTLMTSLSALYVGAIGRIYKLDLNTLAVLDFEPLDGNQVSELSRDNNGIIYAQTSAGTIWGVPAF